MKRLADKVAVITGSGSGQGRAAALLFADEGAKVVVADINGDGAKETVAMIREKGGETIDFTVDLKQPEGVQAMVDEALKSYGKIDVLYNNASRTRFSQLHKMSLEDWNFVLASEITSVFLCCKYTLPAMIEQGKGSIINVGSIVALVGMSDEGITAHGMAKAAIVGLTKNMAAEYAQHGIRVNVICPGVIATPAIAKSLQNPDWVRSKVGRVPLGRLGKADDIAPLALYLASDESSYTTGGVFVVDGGWTTV